MTTFIDITQNILCQNTISFDTRFINREHVNVPLKNSYFGILDFKAVTSEKVTDILEFLFVIDCSGSMSDICSDGRSKMQHITHTLKNMIIFFKENPSIHIYITVNAFDTKIYKIVERTAITKENFTKILTSIDNVYPRGSTNIEYALINSAEEINKVKNLYTTHKINHIFMTDGEAVTGSKDISQLQSHIILDVTNIFIGFGIDHDSALLNGISSVGKSAYYFIDKLENAGLVYGEILHSIVYKLLTEPEISIKNGLIYDYKTNAWVEKLQICDIVSESNKTYNIASTNPDECRVEIKAKLSYDLTIIFPSIRIDNSDLTKHIYRQRTLQLLFEVNEFLKKDRENRMIMPIDPFQLTPIKLDIRRQNSHLHCEEKTLKKCLFEFITEMKKYMTENGLENDKYIKNLCDDIYVCYRTFDTSYGNMFCVARQTSQGAQRIYSATNTDIIDDDLNQRTTRLYGLNTPINLNDHFDNYDNDNDNDNDNSYADNYNDNDNRTLSIRYLDELHHELSNFNDTPYLTPQSTSIIRSISAPNSD
jgi:hypothetical protein